MVWAVPLLVIVGVVAGPVLALVQRLMLRRLIGWLVVVAVVSATEFILVDEGPMTRLVGICCVLLGGMKGMVYAESAQTQGPPLLQYGVFAFLWLGMDIGSFRNRRSGLSWKNDVRLGLLLIFVGTLGAWLVWKVELRQVFILFLPMSLGFHFGVLRVLKGCLRAMGYPVRTLFPNLLKTHGIGDFWSKRWNVGYSQMMQRLIGRPVEVLAGSVSGVMAVFVVSGVFHELAITVPVRSGYGLPTLYFTFHGILVVLEKKWGHPVGRLVTLLAVVLPLGLLFPPAFRNEVLVKCLAVFDLIN